MHQILKIPSPAGVATSTSATYSFSRVPFGTICYGHYSVTAVASPLRGLVASVRSAQLLHLSTYPTYIYIRLLVMLRVFLPSWCSFQIRASQCNLWAGQFLTCGIRGCETQHARTGTCFLSSLRTMCGIAYIGDNGCHLDPVPMAPV